MFGQAIQAGIHRDEAVASMMHLGLTREEANERIMAAVRRSIRSPTLSPQKAIDEEVRSVRSSR